MRGIVTIEESHATGKTREIYHDVERALGIPFPGLTFRALAPVADVLESIWPQVKKNAATQSFSALSGRLQRQADEAVAATFELEDLYSWLKDHDFSREDTRRIRYSLDMLHHANPRLLLITASLYAALHNITDPRFTRPRPTVRNSHEPEYPTKIDRVMMEQAPLETKEIYLDAAEAAGVPVVPDDFLILGNWPTFLRRAWESVKPVMHSMTFINEASDLSVRATQFAQELPYPTELSNTDIEVRRLVDIVQSLYARTTMATAAVRWMVIEGERINRVAGRAAGEATW